MYGVGDWVGVEVESLLMRIEGANDATIEDAGVGRAPSLAIERISTFHYVAGAGKKIFRAVEVVAEVAQGVVDEMAGRLEVESPRIFGCRWQAGVGRYGWVGRIDGIWCGGGARDGVGRVRRGLGDRCGGWRVCARSLDLRC